MMSFNTHFQQGCSFKQFVSQGNTEEIKAVNVIQKVLQQDQVISPQCLTKLQAVNHKVNLLVVGEMFCPDCHINMSAFNFMAEQQKNINMAIVSREYAKSYLIEALGLTEIKIPLLVVLDTNMQLIYPNISDNLFIERPKTVKKITNFDQVKNAYLSGEYLADTIDEVLVMINRDFCE